jgi:hypothetical protein
MCGADSRRETVAMCDIHSHESEPPGMLRKKHRSTPGGLMQDMWHFEEEVEGWHWVHTDLLSGAVSRSPAAFISRSACMVDALDNGYLVSRRTYGPSRTATVH